MAPDRADLHERRGNALRGLARAEEAVGAYARALELEPGRGTLWVDKGDALIDANRIDEAIEAFEKAAAVDPDSMAEEVWTVRGDRAYNAGDFDSADFLYRRGIEVAPSAGGLRGLGLVQQARGEYEDALHYYTEAVELQPDATFENDRAVMLLWLGRTEEAMEAFIRSTVLDPEQPQLWINVGYMHFEGGRFYEAREAYEKAIALDSNRADTWIDLGRCDLELDSLQEALDAFERAIELDGEDSLWGWNNAGYTLSVMGRNEEALSYLDKAIEIAPTESLPWINKVEALFELGRLDEAEEAIDAGMSHSGDEVSALRLRSKILTEKRGRHEEALELLERASSLAGDEELVQLDLAELLVRAGQYTKGRRLARRALERPDLRSSAACAMLFTVYISYVLGWGINRRRERAFESFVDYYRTEFVEQGVTKVDWKYDGTIDVIRNAEIPDEDRLLLLTLVDAQGAEIDPWTLAYFSMSMGVLTN